MMRVLFGQDVEDFDALSRDYRTAKRLLEASEQRRKSAEHGWHVASGDLRDVQEAFDQLSAELRDVRAELARVRQSERMFKQAFVTLGAKFIERAPEYAAVES